MSDPAIRTALHTSALRLPWHRAEPGVAAERAFSQQYERHHQAIYRYCRSILRDEHEAQDALQITMIKALEAMRAGTLTGDIRPWLFRVAHNECISMRRRTAQTTPLEAPDELGREDLARRVDERAAIAQLRTDLDDLAERPRTALVLREFSGLSHDEIAGILDTTPGAVKQTIFEARKALLECQAGRAMSCDDIQRILSDHDGRTMRSRKVRAHVRDCAACTAFLAAMQERPRQLALLAPALPAAAGSALLGHMLGAGHAAGLGTAAGTAAGGATLAGSASVAGAGSAVATSVGLKVAAVIAATAVATGGGAVALREHSSSNGSAPAPAGTPAAPAGSAGAGAAGGAAPGTGSSDATGTRARSREGDAAATTPTTDRTPGAASAAEPADGATSSGSSVRSKAASSSGAGASSTHRRNGSAKPSNSGSNGASASSHARTKTKSSTGAGTTKKSTGNSGSTKGAGSSGSSKAPAKADAPANAAPATGASSSGAAPAGSDEAADAGTGGPAAPANGSSAAGNRRRTTDATSVDAPAP